MSAPPGDRINLDFNSPLAPPAGDLVGLHFAPVHAQPGAVGGFDAARVGSVGVRLRAQFLKPAGWSSAAFPTWPSKSPRIERAALRVQAAGWVDGQISAPEYVRWRRYVAPVSAPAGGDVPVPISVRLAGGYQPAPGSNVILNFAEPLAVPPGGAMVLEFGASGYSRVLGATVGPTSAFGVPALTKPDQVRPTGFGPLAALGVPHVEGNVRYVSLSVGIEPPTDQVGRPILTKKATALLAAGFIGSSYGAARIWNWRQYLFPSGLNGLAAGAPYVIGGVRSVAPGSIGAGAVGSVGVVNTRANRSLAVTGIPAPGFGALNVSPRIVYPLGLAAGAFGTPKVQKHPQLLGFVATLWGRPTVEYRTKVVRPPSLETAEPGFPRVFDPTRKLFPTSVVQAAVFGDTRIANRSAVVRASGFDSLAIAPWAVVENTRRVLLPAGWSALALGGQAIRNRTPSVVPLPIAAPAVPVPLVAYRRRSIFFAGINSLAMGKPAATKTPEIAPNGFAGAVGTPVVWPRVRRLEVRGDAQQAFGATTAWFRYRVVAPGGSAVDAYGTGRIEHGRRTMLALGAQQTSYGVPAIALRNRRVAPPSIWVNFAANHMVGGLRFLRPIGYDAAAFGTRVIPEIQQVFPLGFVGAFGLAELANRRRLLRPSSITTTPDPADRWGRLRVWNLRQFVRMFFDPDSDLNPPRWPQWTLIANRNRVVRVTGQVMTRPGNTVVANNAAPVLPAGIEPPAWPRAGMVAYGVRRLRLEGIEAPYIASWSRIFNAAPALSTSGFRSEVFGRPALENTRRFYRFQGWDSAWAGYPMIAFRIRTLDIESRYGIAPPPVRLPEVKLYTRYLEPQGADGSGFGATFLSIHWTIITPRWTARDFFGEPAVRNKTPELRTRGRAADEWGDAFVRLQWRPVAPVGALTQILPRPAIAFRDRLLPVVGIKAWAFGDKLTVVRTGAPPYSTQIISLRGTPDSAGNELEDGFGIGVPGSIRYPDRTPQVPAPIINQQVLYVRQENPMTLWGAARVTANTIRVEPGIQEYTIGEPAVSLRIRTLAVGSYPDVEVATPSKARVTPHTIWAVVEAPLQAVQNHPPQLLHLVNSMVAFGATRVTLQHRVLRALGDPMELHGVPVVQNRRHYLRPTAFNSFRSGWHVVPGPQTVEQFDALDQSAWGTPTVARPPYVGPAIARPAGLAALSFGAPLVEFFNRTVVPRGDNMQLMGTRKPDDSPFMWQGLRVGPRVPLVIGNFDAARYGEPWVSHRVRETRPVGFDAFLCEYDLTSFAKRMRVIRVNPPRAARYVSPVGLSAFSSSASDVRPLRHYIRPDGNSDQYRKGAF